MVGLTFKSRLISILYSGPTSLLCIV